MDKDIGIENCFKGATLAIVHSDSETARIAHRSQQQPIDSAIAKCCYMLRLIFKNESLFLLVMMALFFQKVHFHRESRQFPANRTKRINCEDVDFDEVSKSCKPRFDTSSHYAFEGVCARIIGNDPTYFQWSKARDCELYHVSAIPGRIGSFSLEQFGVSMRRWLR